MRRALTVWQIIILLLLLSAVISTYVLLVAAWQWRQERQASAAATAVVSPRALELLAPRPGGLYRLGDPVPINVALTRQGFSRAELLVDGQAIAATVNADPTLSPWLIHFSWTGSTAGVYALSVQAQEGEGQWTATAPITVTVVPTGSLYFASSRDGGYAIYRMGADGHASRRLTVGPGDARQPCTLADGTLVYAAGTGDGRSVIYLSLAGETAPIMAGSDPACQAAGGRLAGAASVDGISQVATVSARGGVPQVVTAEAVYAGQPAWSPDGSQIAYVAGRGGNWDIALVPAEGGQARLLTDDPAQDWAPAWSPDGTRLAFVSNREGAHQVYTMRADGTRVERVTNLAGGAESPTWSPDGFWLAFVGYGGFGAGVDAREIYVVRADGLFLVRLTYNRADDTDVTWASQP